MSPNEASRTTRRLSRELGFERCGITTAEPIGRSGYLRAWLDAGRAGSMAYLHRFFEQRCDPGRLLDGARSVIVVARQYHQRPPRSAASDGPRGRVAMYAWGDDYHHVLRRGLGTLVERLREALDVGFEARICVDTSPLLERELAARAGVGWIGKNTLALHESLGSYFFLGALITTLELEPDEPATDHCGSCTACLDACPTAAFPAPYQMDASRCISYLTIEHRGDISKPFQEMMGDWLFGCDVCQDVCPYNRGAPLTTEAAFAVRGDLAAPGLEEIRRWSPEAYRRVLRGSAMRRAKLDMLKRNAAVVEANLRRTTGAAAVDVDSIRAGSQGA